MSKILKIATDKDATVVYQFVKLLAKTHGKNGTSFAMSEKRFIEAFNKKIFSVHLFKEHEYEISGILLHMKEYSINFNGFGSYLDDFYLDSSLRGKGFGRRMLGELCQNLLNYGQKFIKVVFHKNMDLDNFYNHLGFVNYSDKNSLNLYEGINEDLESILRFNDNLKNEIEFRKITEDNLFPVFEVKVEKDLLFYTFCCQFFFNSWLGFGILFTDFIGSTEIVRLSDFKSTIEFILNEIGWKKNHIQTLWWQVLENQKELGKCILSSYSENLHREGWKISIINEKEMEKLSKSVA